jgi:hypothetical protein
MSINDEMIEIPSDWSLWPLAHLLPISLPAITLRHGQVLWLLTKLGFAEGITQHTFHVYVKSLRRLGIPFGQKKFRSENGNRLAYYSYLQIMELALALSLRVYQVIPDPVLKEVVRHRAILCKFYIKAYSRRRGGEGTPIIVPVNARERIEIRGLFLDLNIRFSGGQLVHFGPPKLLTPAKALSLFIESTAPVRRFPPINLSLLSEQVVALTVLAPNIRSGPQPNGG